MLLPIKIIRRNFFNSLFSIYRYVQYIMAAANPALTAKYDAVPDVVIIKAYIKIGYWGEYRLQILIIVN